MWFDGISQYWISRYTINMCSVDNWFPGQVCDKFTDWITQKKNKKKTRSGAEFQMGMTNPAIECKATQTENSSCWLIHSWAVKETLGCIKSSSCRCETDNRPLPLMLIHFENPPNHHIESMHFQLATVSLAMVNDWLHSVSTTCLTGHWEQQKEED